MQNMNIEKGMEVLEVLARFNDENYRIYKETNKRSGSIRVLYIPSHLKNLLEVR